MFNNEGTPNTNNPSSEYSIESLALDCNDNRTRVVDSTRAAVLAMDLDTGARTALTDREIPDGQNRFITHQISRGMNPIAWH